MKKIKFKIRQEDLHLRNEMHFEIQLRNRMQIHQSKKLYNRAAMKRETRLLASTYQEVHNMSFLAELITSFAEGLFGFESKPQVREVVKTVYVQAPIKTKPGVSKNKKITFFDRYRELDCKLGRLVGEGSGGITMMIKAYKQGLLRGDGYSYAMPRLIKAREYRNQIAHTKEKWENVQNPNGGLLNDLNYIFDLIKQDGSHIAKAMRKASKGNNHSQPKQSKKHDNYGNYQAYYQYLNNQSRRVYR